jgi:phytoene dehydrogenase-like protein
MIEAEETIGGGMRSAELTLPGFIHDICSAVHPLAVASPFFRSLPLDEHGLEWVYPAAQLAHPLDDGTAVMLERSVEATAEGLGGDADAYCKLIAPLVRDWDKLGPILLSPKPLPRYPIKLARFGLYGIRSAQGLAASAFTGARARLFRRDGRAFNLASRPAHHG